MVVEDNQLRDRSVHAHVLVFDGDIGNRTSNQTLRLKICFFVGNGHFTGFLVQRVTPESLQETLRADDCTGFPRTRDIQRPHGHFVHAEHVGAIGVIHFVRGDDVLQRLAHLAVFAGHRLTLIGETCCLVAFDFVGGHILSTLVLEGVGLNVPLVEQRVVWLCVRHMTQVEENLLPEARVQQVKNRVLNATDVQVGATGFFAFARAHPVVEVLRRSQRLGVLRIGVAHFVPA